MLDLQLACPLNSSQVEHNSLERPKECVGSYFDKTSSELSICSNEKMLKIFICMDDKRYRKRIILYH